MRRILLLFLLLSGVGMAAPRIALIQPIEGEATLAGKRLTAPSLAREGDRLSLPSGCSVRVQLLGSGKEMTVEGPLELDVTKARLRSEATELSRGSLSVEQNLGSIARAAGGIRRGHKTLGVKVSKPERSQDGQWRVHVRITEEFDPDKVGDGGIFFSPADNFSRETATRIDIPTSSESFRLDPSLTTVGQRYYLQVSFDEFDSTSYERHYRLLTADEEKTLQATALRLRNRARRTRDVGPLLELAWLYQAMDQTEKVAEVLWEAYNSRHAKKLSQSTLEDLRSQLNVARKSLDLKYR